MSQIDRNIYFQYFDQSNLISLKNQVEAKGKISELVEKHHLLELEKNCIYFQKLHAVECTDLKLHRPFLTTFNIHFEDLLYDKCKLL